jgi:hypothetical protein
MIANATIGARVAWVFASVPRLSWRFLPHRRGGLRRGQEKAVVSDEAIEFPMVSDAGATVRCIVPQGAIDWLARISSPARVKPSSINPLSVYLDWQSEIETIASAKYGRRPSHSRSCRDCSERSNKGLFPDQALAFQGGASNAQHEKPVSEPS